jgi:hypothetical protein
MGSNAFKFQPIAVNANAPKGACILRTFDDISAFILTNLEHQRGRTPHWVAVRRVLLQARHEPRRDTLAVRAAELSKRLCCVPRFPHCPARFIHQATPIQSTIIASVSAIQFWNGMLPRMTN